AVVHLAARVALEPEVTSSSAKPLSACDNSRRVKMCVCHWPDRAPYVSFDRFATRHKLPAVPGYITLHQSEERRCKDRFALTVKGGDRGERKRARNNQRACKARRGTPNLV